MRVCAIPELKSENKSDEEWSDIETISTQDVQSIEDVECALVSRREREIVVQFHSPGIVASIFPYSYGRIVWEITASVSQHGCGEDANACLIVGNQIDGK